MENIHFMDDPFFLVAGPTKLPNRVVVAAAQPMISHRSATFHDVQATVTGKAKQVLRTEHDVFILTSSGSGGLEASISNFIAPGEKVLCLSVGNFGRKYRDIAIAMGADVEFIEFPWGQAIDPNVVEQRLKEDTQQQIKAILFQQHETSTGVYNPVPEIAAARGNHPALLFADAISGLAACPLETDAWGVDVVIASSQKALMTPPGLALMSVSPRAWEHYQADVKNKSYFDLKRFQASAAKDETPTTPAVSLFYALNEGLSMILEEGLENTIANHNQRRDVVRAAARALGLQLVAEDACASGAITAIYMPQGINPKQILGLTAQKYQTVLCGGMGDISTTSLRFAHVGYVREMDLIVGISALELALKECGHQFELGAGLTAAQNTLYDLHR